MIVTEIKNNLVYTYSDEGYTIIQDGTEVEYYEAYDPIDSGRTYHESTNLKEQPNNEPYIPPITPEPLAPEVFDEPEL